MTLAIPFRSSLILIASGVGLLLGGCASAPNLDVDAARKSSINTIAILSVPEPQELQLANLGGAASAFGLIGGLVQGTNNESQAKNFTAALRGEKITFAQPLADAVADALRKDGYTVIDARDQKAKLSADKKSDDFSDVRVKADAILVIGYGTFGYISEPMSLSYQPWIIIKAHLVDGATKHDLYFKAFVVGWKMKIENVVYIPANEKYRYRSYDAVMANVREAATGLLDSQRLVAVRIGDDLARPSTK